MKIVYFANSQSHKRVIESFGEISGVKQIIVAPKPKITSNAIVEDYSDCGISNVITYGSIGEAEKIIKDLNPNVVAQTNTLGIKIPKHIKKAYISHGMIGDHVVPMHKYGTLHTWKGFDLYCGAVQSFKRWIEHGTGKKQNILLNAMPQFDLLYDKQYFYKHKTNILNTTKNPTPRKVILFCGFCCKDRVDFKKHNEDYFKTAIELERISKKHNFLTLIKPRQEHTKMMAFLKHVGWSDRYKQSYNNIRTSKYIHFITTATHIYRYFFADMIICNGCSTTEMEACVANRSLLLVRTQVTPDKYDPFNTVSSGSGIHVPDIKDLEQTILDNFDNTQRISKQQDLLRKIGLNIDGNAHKRVQEALIQL